MKKRNPLTFKEQKGDVSFYDSPKGLYQQLGVADPYKVRNGTMTYKHILRKYGYDIKYNNNGVHGFSIFKGKKLLEDNIWKFSEAEKICFQLGG